MSRPRELATPWLPCLLGCTVMAPSIAGGFLNWDDPFSVVHNTALLHGDWSQILSQVTVGIWHPVTLASFALERRWLGPEAWHFHALNVLLHGLVSALALLWLRALHPQRPAVALCGGLLFCVHPLHVESVAWISERKDLLSGAFYLGALLAYERFHARGRGSFPLLALASFALGLLSKPMLVSLPLVLLAVDHWRGRRDAARCVLEKLPFLGLALAVGLRSLVTQAPAPDESFEIYESSWLERIVLAAQALAFYTAKWLWPARLSVYYDQALVQTGAAEWALALPLGCALIAAAWRRPARANSARLALLFYLLALAPVLKLLPFGGNSMLNDRYMYLPSLGLCLGAALAFDAPRFRSGKSASVRWLVLVAVCSLLGLRSAERCLVFRDSGALWSDVLAHYPGTSLALNQLGRHLLDSAGDATRARSLFEQAHRARPESVDPLVNLAELDAQEGFPERALERYEQALERGPSRALLLRATAELLLDQGKRPRARELLERANQIQARRDPLTLLALARVAALDGDRDAARRLLRESLSLAPRLAAAYAALAALELAAGNPAEARSHADVARLLGAELSPGLLERIEVEARRRAAGSDPASRPPEQ